MTTINATNVKSSYDPNYNSQTTNLSFWNNKATSGQADIFTESFMPSMWSYGKDLLGSIKGEINSVGLTPEEKVAKAEELTRQFFTANNRTDLAEAEKNASSNIKIMDFTRDNNNIVHLDDNEVMVPPDGTLVGLTKLKNNESAPSGASIYLYLNREEMKHSTIEEIARDIIHETVHYNQYEDYVQNGSLPENRASEVEAFEWQRKYEEGNYLPEVNINETLKRGYDM